MKRSLLLGALLLGGVLAPATPAHALPDAPGAPGQNPTWAPANKDGYGTSKTLDSKVWFTLQNGAVSEIYYPDLGTPSVRDMKFAVTDGSTFADLETDGATHSTTLTDARSLTYKVVNTAKNGRWRLTKTYVTDPDRPTVLLNVDFESLTGQPLKLYTIYNPRLSNSGSYSSDDHGRTDGDALVAEDGKNGSALVSAPAFAETTSGYFGSSSDGWNDLKNDFDLDGHYDANSNGNVVQTGRLNVTGLGSSRTATIALGFGRDAGSALTTARASLTAGFADRAAEYADGWHDYVATLKPPPASLKTDREKAVYNSSIMILAAHEDKTYRGAFVASPTMPWAWGTNPNLENPSGAYHLVWARDTAGKAGGLLTAGDPAAADRALTYLFKRQQKSDGSFPQNSKLDGTEHWTNTQMDEVAAPIILAWTAGRKDADTWSHVRRAADYIVANGPITKQERWENQGGYSPATIAMEIAGLVTAADIAQANGDTAARTRYLATADDWQSKLKSWTVTTTGPHSDKPYFLRITKDGKPNNGTTYDVGDSGPNNADQRAVVDPSFLETVRLGVLPPNDPDILSTIPVVDQQLSDMTPSGRHWHRYNWDGYGEQDNGGEWNFGFPQGSQTTKGRLWPLFAGERGEYEISAGRPGDAAQRLTDMAATSTQAGLLPEQVWDNRAPAGGGGHVAGRPTFSATPLGWAHGQYVRLAWSIQQNRHLGTPSIVACRYTRTLCDPEVQPPGAPGKPVASDITASSVKLTWTASTAGSAPVKDYAVYRDGSLAGTSASTSLTVSGLSPGTEYAFHVVARDTEGRESAPSPVTTVRTDSASTPSCKVTYRVASDWGSGFWVDVQIANTGTTTVDGWSLGFSFPGDQRVTGGHSANWTQTGRDVTATDSGWNGTLTPGSATQIGFQADGSPATPSEFTLNGRPCTKG
ncbi:MAG TPA: glycoside hydrolase family 15 protein [Thermomonospora sp.]|nr:glycoside hydrolase family 15 protein [Thermomonospora sp.]